MSKRAIQRENGTSFEWATTPPRLVDGECEWTTKREAALDVSDVAPDVLAKWLPCIVGEHVRPVWFDNNPEVPVDDREERRQAALSELAVSLAKGGDAEALAVVEVRAGKGDERAVAFLEAKAQAEADEVAKAEEAARIEAKRKAAEEQAAKEAEAAPAEDVAFEAAPARR